jgi:two-component system, OmpR family, phosphate regulon sensor histidine kinase PhoR
MHWLLPRLTIAAAAVSLGAAVGHSAGLALELPRAGLALGALCGAGMAVALDAWRARRLLAWLRGAQGSEAPRTTGFWGEFGYRIERALRTRERDLAAERRRIEQFLSAIDASPNGVVLLDERGQLQWCNSTAADHLGLDPLRDLRQPLTNLVRTPEFVTHLQSGDDQDAVQFSMPGRPGTLSVLVRPYGDGQRLLLTQDITERARTDEMRRDFVANVSHEIRTPLTVLAGFIETMDQVPLTEPERKRALTVMAEQTRRMRTLVDDLLSLAQLEGSPRPPTDRWVDAAALMQHLERDGRSLSGGQHRLEFRIEGGAGAIAGNEAELLSAAGNLVTNAVRYTPAGGRIDVAWLRRANGSGVLEVRDSGPGIAAEHLPRLGERFYRVDSGRSRDSGGTGLGLAIAKHAVRRHGGELEVESELGRGSIFRLIFPPARVR